MIHIKALLIGFIFIMLFVGIVYLIELVGPLIIVIPVTILLSYCMGRVILDSFIN